MFLVIAASQLKRAKEGAESYPVKSFELLVLAAQNSSAVVEYVRQHEKEFLPVLIQTFTFSPIQNFSELFGFPLAKEAIDDLHAELKENE